jgi:Flp pilus assembly protein TadB
MLCCLIAFVVLVIHAWLASPARFAAVIVVFVLSFAFEAIYLSYTRKKRAA